MVFCLYKHLILFFMYLSSKHKSFNKHCLLYSGALDIFTRRHMHHCINIYCTRWLLWRFPPLKKLQSTFIVLHCMLIKYIVCSTLRWDQLDFMVNLTRTNILFYVVDIFCNISLRQPQSPLPTSKKKSSYENQCWPVIFFFCLFVM